MNFTLLFLLNCCLGNAIPFEIFFLKVSGFSLCGWYNTFIKVSRKGKKSVNISTSMHIPNAQTKDAQHKSIEISVQRKMSTPPGLLVAL